MKLYEFLKPGNIIIDCTGTDTESVLREMVSSLKMRGTVSNETLTFDKLMEREKLGSTFLGNHTAVPHTRLKELSDPVVAIGISRSGFMYHADDKEKAHLIILILSPTSSRIVHLQILAAAAALIKNSGKMVKEMTSVKTSEKLVELIRKYESNNDD